MTINLWISAWTLATQTTCHCLVSGILESRTICIPWSAGVHYFLNPFTSGSSDIYSLHDSNISDEGSCVLAGALQRYKSLEELEWVQLFMSYFVRSVYGVYGVVWNLTIYTELTVLDQPMNCIIAIYYDHIATTAYVEWIPEFCAFVLRRQFPTVYMCLQVWG